MSQGRASWLVIGVYLLGVLATQASVVNPDALEMGLVGQDLFGGDRLNLDVHHYPPVFPVVSAMASLVLPLPAAILVLAPLAFCGVLVALVRLLGAPLGGLSAAVLVGVLWSSPELAALSVSPDPRGLQLAFFYGGVVLLLGSAHLARGVGVGLLSGLLVLTRPEGILFAVLLLAVACVLWRRRVGPALACFAGVVLPYLWWVSSAVGSVSLNSRAWEIKGAGLLELLPVRPLIHLWGAGAQTTPFREVLREIGPQASVPQESFLGALWAAAGELGAGLLPLWWVAAVWGALRLWRTKKTLLVLLVGTIGVSMALYLVPMGRDLALPLINLLPGLVALHVLAVLGLVHAVEWLSQRSQAGAIGVTAVVLLAGGWALRGGQDVAQSESLHRAASWMKAELSEDAQVASSLGSAPLVHLAEKHWVRIPSRWERAVLWEGPEYRPDYLVLSSTDGLWMLGPPALNTEESGAKPAAFFRDERGWVLLLELGEETGAGHLDESGIVVEGLERSDSAEELPRNLEEAGADEREGLLR